MPVANTEIAELFERYATLLEIDGANPFRVRAYRNAARTLENLPQSAVSMLEAGEDLSELSGIGEDLADKIGAIARSGRFDELEELQDDLPASLAEIAALPGIGPKRVARLYEALGVERLDELEKAAKDERLRKVEGFGARTEQKILDEIARRAGRQKRYRLASAEQMAAPLLAYLRDHPGIKEAEIAGSYRRRKETVGDLDILVTAARDAEVMEHFVAYDDVEAVIAKGSTRSTIRLRSGLEVDLRLVPAVGWGAALHYFTGAKAHNVQTRQIAAAKHWKLNEYGLFDGDERIAGKTEEEVYQALGLAYVEPELREDRGEIEAARDGKLPELVTVEDLKGDLHCHTRASDGRDDLETMARTARERGHAYLAISDHSQHMRLAGGLSAKRLREQLRAIDELNRGFDDFRLLKALEVDILEDGRLDMDPDVLNELDLRICSIHDALDLPGDKQTERLIKAMDDPRCNVVAHPTGRLINKRDPYRLDLERVMEAALERGCFLEINAQPQRLDLNDRHARMAKEMGLKLAISTDAHSASGLAFLRFGIDQARRARLEPDDVLNTRSWPDLQKLLCRN
ncbi:MAG: DNA polymerase/3'-5' exonuclease PolX [Geminicoccaceae bacterium]|nr:MAG: DNA polymerase/3'-5' exonuclease PolX [Geminicoccaceae bacterium]